MSLEFGPFGETGEASRDGSGKQSRSSYCTAATTDAQNVEKRMKTKVLVTGAGVVALIAGIALAQTGGHGERMFKRADIDGDGRITEAESETLRKTRFRMLDANADGAVTMQEIREGRQRMRDGHMKDRFGKLDANGNGTVEKSEYDAMADRRFERMDADKDGVLTLDEIRDHRHMHHQRDKDG